MAQGTIPIPSGFGITQLTIHERELDGGAEIPFAGTLLVQLRLDAPEGSSGEDILAQDLAMFEKSFDGFELVERGTFTLGPRKLPRLEYRLLDPEHGQKLQQMVVYFELGGDPYSLTATHRSQSFERVRAAVPAVIDGLLEGQP